VTWLVPLAVLLVCGVGVWGLSVRLRDVSIVDVAWGPMFIAVAGVAYVLGSGNDQRQLLVLGMVTVWGLRLALHLARRSRGQPEDPRYRAMRERNGRSWWWTSLFWVFWLQGALAWVVSLPILACMNLGRAAPPSVTDAVGVVLFVLGLVMESVADAELRRFREDPANRSRVFDRGLFRYSRHPNYFGDALVWWGIGALGVSAGAPWSLIGPFLMTVLLMWVSGVALTERTIEERRPAYSVYKETTSAFFPWPPRKPTTHVR